MEARDGTSSEMPSLEETPSSLEETPSSLEETPSSPPSSLEETPTSAGKLSSLRESTQSRGIAEQ
jgi:hypothetical protein|tara:strand:- start:1063 stop:1257 length:195 start_codon:yes stop_codon:yes gene_type:complete